MPPSIEEIVEIYAQRKHERDPRITAMQDLRDAYQGDIAIPLPELDKQEKPMVANLIATGLDQTAQRIASTMPDILCPPMRPGIQASEDMARTRRLAMLGWWSMSKLGLVQRRRARWLLGYASAPVVVRPDMKRHVPMWHARDPLSAFPPPGDEMTPDDCIFTFKRTLRWLQQRYPAAVAPLYKGASPRPDDEFEVLEYIDADILTLIVLGKKRDQQHTLSPPLNAPGSRPFAVLEPPVPNKAGICTAVVPGRICLDRQMGQFDGLIGLFWWQSKMMALEGIAVERGIFPDEWLISRPNEVAQIVHPADGVRGEIGKVTGGDIQLRPIQPGMQTYPTLDRIERAMRVTGGIPAEFGGESGTNIRTARRGAAVLSSAVDFPIQEAQDIFAASLQEENIRGIAIDKAYFGNMQKSFWFSWNGKKGRAKYVPNDDFETDEHSVYYSFPGSDINQLVIGTGQRIGMETMSKRRGMELDPLIDDPLLEHERILAEALETAFLQSLQQQATQGALSPADLARISELVVSKRMPLYAAVQTAQKEAQQRQATSGAPGTPTGPAAPGSPDAQPGLGGGGPGAPAGAAIQPGPPSLDNLSTLMSNLRRPGRVSPEERGVA